MAGTYDPWLVEDCMMSENGDDGLFLFAGTVRDSVASYNLGNGIVVYDGVVESCQGNYNSNIGIRAHGSVRGCSADQNGNQGFYGGGVIRDCSADFNTADGFNVHGVVTDCQATGNGADGFYLEIETRIEGCQANDNTGAGIRLRYSMMGGHMTVENNTMARNGYGIHCGQSTENFIARNKAFYNTTNYLICAGNNDAAVVSPGAAFTNAGAWANFSE